MDHPAKREQIAELLALPYARVFRAEEEGGFSAELLEFPGCFATGDDPGEVWDNLEEAIFLWVEAQLAEARRIPTPAPPSDLRRQSIAWPENPPDRGSDGRLQDSA